jgi:hypothetical protein
VSPENGPRRILEILWWSFVAGAVVLVLVVAFVLTPLAGAAPPWADFLLVGGIAAAVPAWLLRRRYAERGHGAGGPENLRGVQRQMFVGLTLAELPMYVGLVHYIFTGQVNGIAVLTIVTVWLMAMFHPSRLTGEG